jgi:hypothetical protein
MLATHLEQLRQSLLSDGEPEPAYLIGRTILYLAGGEVLDDSGKKIVSSELYCVTTRGIFLVE